MDTGKIGNANAPDLPAAIQNSKKLRHHVVSFTGLSNASAGMCQFL
jgi:hypothetical protein